MVKEDYIMRIIHEAVRTLLKLLFNIDEEKEDEIEFEDIELEKAHRRLKLLAQEGKINEAENQLWELLDGSDREAFKLALLFYDYINTFEEEQLDAAGYSREEIDEGILAVAKNYGYEGMVGALLEQSGAN